MGSVGTTGVDDRTINLNAFHFQTRSGTHGGFYVRPDSLDTARRAAAAFSALGREIYQHRFQALPARLRRTYCAKLYLSTHSVSAYAAVG